MEITWREENEKFSFYKPNGSGERYVDLVGNGKDILCTYSAANGVGKTTLAVNILGNLIWGPQSKFFKKPLFENWPYPKRARYITDPKLVEEIGPFHQEIKKWWPKGGYVSEKGGKSYFSQYKAGDWIIDVMTYDQEMKQFEGGTLGLVICDEPPPEPIYNASIGRLRLGGLFLVLMTPLTHASYFYEKVAPRHEDHIVYATIESACKQHGVRGHLEHDHIERMMMEWPPEEIEARAYGKALYLRGIIFPTFNKNVHVLKTPIKPPSHASVYQVVDPHSDKPFACIWAFPDMNGDIYIFDEWPNEDFYRMHNCQLTIRDYKKIFEDKEQGFRVSKRIIDRHFADVSSAVNKRTLREELNEDVGLYYDPSYTASEEIDVGIHKVRTYLQYESDKPLTSLNKPKLFINPGCTNTIRSLSNWSRNPDNGKVQDQFKDFCDVVRYLLMEDPRIEESVPRKEPQKLYG